jgi:hypothetical protein
MKRRYARFLREKHAIGKIFSILIRKLDAQNNIISTIHFLLAVMKLYGLKKST